MKETYNSINLKRISQLSSMLSKILNEDYEISKERIIGTDVGKGILNNKQRYLYEQYSSNLYEIIEEILPNNDAKKNDIIEKIKVYSNYDYDEKLILNSESCIYDAVSIESKTKIQKKLKAAQKRALKAQYNNLLDIRRLENAIKITR